MRVSDVSHYTIPDLVCFFFLLLEITLDNPAFDGGMRGIFCVGSICVFVVLCVFVFVCVCVCVVCVGLIMVEL